MTRIWLKDWPWETVVTVNAGLCKEKKALHKPTSDGYAPAQQLWESACRRELTLRQTLDICRQCHKLAPFCFYNGNTFAAIGRTMIQDVVQKLPPLKAQTLRSAVGHYIAGTAGAEELAKALQDLN
ncbi:MAG TPA: hypothetical protein VNX46_12035 [Candidatus Acidoferrum sp.]|jgi:hypothetical protein|nr:hypothetical protein [Candidatus Acidoferrum sp.]